MPLPMSEGSRTRPVPGWARHNASSRNKMRFIVLFGYVHRCRARLFAGGAAVGQRVAGIHFRMAFDGDFDPETVCVPCRECRARRGACDVAVLPGGRAFPAEYLDGLSGSPEPSR